MIAPRVARNLHPGRACRVSSASIVYRADRRLDLFRVGKTFFRDLGPTTERSGRSLDRLAAHERPDAGRLSDATASLRASQARLEVQLERDRGGARAVERAARGVSAQVTRVAAIDLGTNTTRLLVADVVDGTVESSRAARRSRASARASTSAAACSRCRSRASGTASPTTGAKLERLGAERALLIATSAVRDAENGEAFLGEIEWRYGFATRLLTGDEEAELTLRGVGGVEPRHARARHRRRLDRARGSEP